MNSRSLSTLALVVLGILLALWSGVSILLNPTGGIAGLSKLVTVIAVLISLVNPKIGLFVIAAQAIYTDQLKRVGVYYGAVSMETVQEILIGPLLTLAAINASFFVNLIMGKVRLGKLGWLLYCLVPVMMAYFFLGGGIGGGDSFMKRAYNAATAGMYMTIVPLCYGLMKEFQDWIRFLSFQAVVAFPAASWAIWQYYNGFSNLEWTYALSGLSPVHSGQMLTFEDPRVFGFFGSASALGCIGGYGSYCIWRGFRERRFRWPFLAMGAIYMVVIVLSHQRSLLLFPLIFLVFAFSFRTRLTTISIYGAVVLCGILGVMNSTWLLNEGIHKINKAIAVQGRWGEDTLTVSTFSDRLRGWERLSRLESWSLFGTGEEMKSSMAGLSVTAGDYNHDMVNRILIQFGAVGLLLIVGVAASIAFVLHRVVWKLPDKRSQKDGAFILAVIVPIAIMSAMGGDNLTTTPYNLMIWSIFAGVFVLKRTLDEKSLLTLAAGSLPDIPSHGATRPLGAGMGHSAGVTG